MRPSKWCLKMACSTHMKGTFWLLRLLLTIAVSPDKRRAQRCLKVPRQSWFDEFHRWASAQKKGVADTDIFAASQFCWRMLHRWRFLWKRRSPLSLAWCDLPSIKRKAKQKKTPRWYKQIASGRAANMKLGPEEVSEGVPLTTRAVFRVVGLELES